MCNFKFKITSIEAYSSKFMIFLLYIVQIIIKIKQIETDVKALEAKRLSKSQN
jgi:hypothetical protein